MIQNALLSDYTYVTGCLDQVTISNKGTNIDSNTLIAQDIIADRMAVLLIQIQILTEQLNATRCTTESKGITLTSPAPAAIETLSTAEDKTVSSAVPKRSARVFRSIVDDDVAACPTVMTMTTTTTPEISQQARRIWRESECNMPLKMTMEHALEEVGLGKDSSSSDCNGSAATTLLPFMADDVSINGETLKARPTHKRKSKSIEGKVSIPTLLRNVSEADSSSSTRSPPPLPPKLRPTHKKQSKSVSTITEISTRAISNDSSSSFFSASSTLIEDDFNLDLFSFIDKSKNYEKRQASSTRDWESNPADLSVSSSTTKRRSSVKAESKAMPGLNRRTSTRPEHQILSQMIKTKDKIFGT